MHRVQLNPLQSAGVLFCSDNYSDVRLFVRFLFVRMFASPYVSPRHPHTCMFVQTPLEEKIVAILNLQK